MLVRLHGSYCISAVYTANAAKILIRMQNARRLNAGVQRWNPRFPSQTQGKESSELRLSTETQLGWEFFLPLLPLNGILVSHSAIRRNHGSEIYSSQIKITLQPVWSFNSSSIIKIIFSLAFKVRIYANWFIYMLICSNLKSRRNRIKKIDEQRWRKRRIVYLWVSVWSACLVGR